jgi:hypothetical protein
LEDRLVPAILTVNTLDDAVVSDGFLSLREAVQVVNTDSTANLSGTELAQVDQTSNPLGINDTIVFDPALASATNSTGGPVGTIVLGNMTSGGGQLELSRPGATPSDAIKIDGTGTITISANYLSRIFQVDAGVEAELDNVTLVNGRDPTRGGAIVNDGTLTISGSTLFNNSTYSFDGSQGGAIDNDGTLMISGSTLSRNYCKFGGVGGAIVNYGTATITGGSNLSYNGTIGIGGAIENFGTLSISDSTLSVNGAGEGGAIDNYGSLAISGSTLSRNSAGYGGAIANVGTATISNGSTLSGNSATSDGGAIYNLVALRISDSTISANVSSSWGGGIMNDYPGATLTLSNCKLSGNSANSGGALYDDAGSTSILTNNCTLSQNQAANDGGGIAQFGGGLTLSGSTLSSNTAGGNGGGIENEASSLTLSDCTLIGNSARLAGGGIHMLANPSPTAALTGCTLVGNYAYSGGGALEIDGEVTTLTDCLLTGNSSPNPGGAIGNYFRDLTITGTSISGNSTGSSGGGIYNSAGTVTITQSTLTTNSAVGDGGAILAVRGGVLTISHSTLSGNFAGQHGGAIEGGPVTITDSTLAGNTAAAGYGGAISGVLTMTGCTLAGNSAGSGGGAISNGSIDTAVTIRISNSTFSGNSAARGGGIFNQTLAPLSIDGCTVSNNSATVSGGGIYNNASGSVFNPPGLMAIELHSAICDNQAPVGADLENLGVLGISHSAIASLDDQNAGATTTVVDPSDTATALTSSVDISGQIVFNVHILAAAGGTPTGTVELLDNDNNLLGTATLDGSSNGQATFGFLPGALGAAAPLHALYSGDGNFTTSTSAPLIQAADALSPDNLQNVVNSLATSPATAVAIQANDDASWVAAVPAINAVMAPLPNGVPAPITVVLDVASGKYSPPLLYNNSDSNVTFILRGSPVPSGTIIDPAKPALIVTSGKVVVENVTFTESGDAPTILVTGGHLMLRDCIVQESTGYNDTAIKITGGSLDLGTTASPGGNTINVNGAGQPILSTGLNLVTAIGNTFEVNGGAVAPPVVTVGLTGSVNPTLLNQPITFTATVSPVTTGAAAPTGSVTFVDLATGATLGSVNLSGGTAQLTTAALVAGTQIVAAIYNGDANYITSAATVVQSVYYHFSGFLAPLNSNLPFAVNRVIPIQFQLTDYNGNFISSLSAITSLQVLDPQGNNVLANVGNTTLRYDPTANQFVANWKTKGLPAGIYTVTLKLADATTYTRTLQLTAPGGVTPEMAASGTNTAAATAGALEAGNLEVYVNNAGGLFTADELARIQDAVNAVDAVVEPFGVSVTETTDSTAAGVIVDTGSSSAVGGYADGVLGCYNPVGEITLLQGWNWYAGADPVKISPNQYDFQTVVTHELGHALGLGHSSDPASCMSATLAAGTVVHSLTTADLAIPYDDTGADGEHAALPQAGGGILDGGRTLRISGSTQSGNTGHVDGGGMVIDPAMATIISRIFTGNAAPVSADRHYLDSAVTDLIAELIAQVGTLDLNSSQPSSRRFVQFTANDLNSEVGDLIQLLG